MHVTGVKRGKTRATKHDWFWFGFPLVEKMARTLPTNQPKQTLNYFRHSIQNRSNRELCHCHTAVVHTAQRNCLRAGIVRTTLTLKTKFSSVTIRFSDTCLLRTVLFVPTKAHVSLTFGRLILTPQQTLSVTSVTRSDTKLTSLTLVICTLFKLSNIQLVWLNHKLKMSV